jgi:hypothetical protein
MNLLKQKKKNKIFFIFLISITTFNSFHSTNTTGINPNHSLVGAVVENPNSKSSKLVLWIVAGFVAGGSILSTYLLYKHLNKTSKDSSQSGSSTKQIPENVKSQIEELNKVNIVSDEAFAKLLAVSKDFRSPISQENPEEQEQKKNSLLDVIIYLNENQRQQLTNEFFNSTLNDDISEKMKEIKEIEAIFTMKEFKEASESDKKILCAQCTKKDPHLSDKINAKISKKINNYYKIQESSLGSLSEEVLKEKLDEMKQNKPLLIAQVSFFIELQKMELQTISEESDPKYHSNTFSTFFGANSIRKLTFMAIQEFATDLLSLEFVNKVADWIKKESSEISESINKISK